MDEKYFYLGFLTGALILIAGTAFLNDLIGQDTDQPPEFEQNNTTDDIDEIMDRQRENGSRETTYGSLRGQKQVTVRQYIPQGRPEVHIYRSNDTPNEDEADYSEDQRCLEDCLRDRRRRHGVVDRNEFNFNLYLGGDEDEETPHPEYRAHHRPDHYREHGYYGHHREHRHYREHTRHHDRAEEERDCDWWNTGYRRLAEAGWHGSDEFECWQ